MTVDFVLYRAIHFTLHKRRAVKKTIDFDESLCETFTSVLRRFSPDYGQTKLRSAASYRWLQP